MAPSAGALVVGGVVAALVTWHGRSPGPNASRPAAPTTTAALPAAPATAAPPASVAPSTAPTRAPGAPLAKPSTEGRNSSAHGGSYTAELELMRSAHNAYAAHDYTNALVLIAEHAHRFPGSILAEEREALRVRCLTGSGRTSEARRAMTAFEKHFPRSVLLQRLEAEVGTNAD
jgi:hypothetical protein